MYLSILSLILGSIQTIAVATSKLFYDRKAVKEKIRTTQGKEKEYWEKEFKNIDEKIKEKAAELEKAKEKAKEKYKAMSKEEQDKLRQSAIKEVDSKTT
jgi:hypothetical protein